MRPRRARLAWFAVNLSGDCATNWSATHLVKALTSSQPSLSWSGTTTCKPLPPVVLAKLWRPIASKASRISTAASVTRGQAKPSSGSRSNVIRLGVASSSTSAPEGWCPAHFPPPAPDDPRQVFDDRIRYGLIVFGNVYVPDRLRGALAEMLL